MVIKKFQSMKLHKKARVFVLFAALLDIYGKVERRHNKQNKMFFFFINDAEKEEPSQYNSLLEYCISTRRKNVLFLLQDGIFSPACSLWVIAGAYHP
jgi:hypothetical protein